MRFLSFGSATLPQLNGRNDSPVSYRSSVVALQNGGFDQDGSNTYLESKNVTATFWVSDSESGITDIDAFIESLMQVADNGRARLIAIRRDGTYVSALAKLVQARIGVDSRFWIPDTLSTTEQGYDAVTVAWEITYPYWLNVDDETKLLDANWIADGSFTFGAGLNYTNTFNSGSLSWSPTLANAGNARHENMTITVEAQTGVSATGDLNITNTETGDTIEWVGTLVAGDVLIIDTLAQTVKLNGVTDYANINLPTSQIPFLTLEVGDNDFTVVFDSITGGDVDVTIAFAKHYVR